MFFSLELWSVLETFFAYIYNFFILFKLVHSHKIVIFYHLRWRIIKNTEKPYSLGKYLLKFYHKAIRRNSAEAVLVSLLLLEWLLAQWQAFSG